MLHFRLEFPFTLLENSSSPNEEVALNQILSSEAKYQWSVNDENLTLLSDQTLSVAANLASQSAIIEEALPEPTLDLTSASYVLLFGRQMGFQDLLEFVALLRANDCLTGTLQAIKPHADLNLGLCWRTEAKDIEQLRSVVMQFAERLSLEACVLATPPPTLAMPGVLVMDMDSTAIQIECIDEMARLHGVYDQIATITAEAMAGGLDFAQSLRKRVGLLKGADANIIQTLLADLPLMPGLSALTELLLGKQWKVAIASGGFLPFTEHLKERLGLTASFANQLEIIDGKLTGEVLGDICDANVKAQVVETLAVDNNIPMQQTVAIGDGANDLTMIHKAGLGVAFHAKPLVKQQAPASISRGSLLQLAYLLSVR